ncbi:MAG: F0F1 ATP synthase subunit A [Armatimonadetes bacterium]|nr:F0F1 ATP synthase subunit A [Candidatus Hippobium faecium]
MEQATLPEYQSWLSVLYKIGVPKWIPDSCLLFIFVVLGLCIFAFFAGRNLSLRTPGKFQIFVEWVVSSLTSFVEGICPQEKKIMTPIMSALFLFILCSNYLGNVPGFTAPTKDVSVTGTLAIMGFVLIQFMGFYRQGFGYLKHFVGEPVWLFPINIPIHVIGELARPISLACRLYGNIYGEEMVVTVLMFLAISVIKAPWFPLHLPLQIFGLLTGFIQAFVFTLLVGIYVSMAVSHEE